MIPESATTGVTTLDVFGQVAVILFMFYFSGVAVFNTSIALRMGYNYWRAMIVSPIWPILYVSERVNQWAKGGNCTLPENHPLRSD